MEIDELVPRRSRFAAWSALEREHIAMDLRTGECTTLDRLSAEIWTRSDGASTVGEILRSLAGPFPVDTDELRRSVMRALGALYRSDLIVFARRGEGARQVARGSH